MTSGFTHKGNIVYYNEAPIFSAPAEIWDKLVPVSTDTVLVGYIPDSFGPKGPISDPPKLETTELHKLINCNVFLIDKTGRIIWRIQNPRKRRRDYMYVYFEDGKWSTFSGSETCDLNIETGYVHNCRFSR